MSYYVAGGGVAACCHPGIAQTDLFVVNGTGQLCVLTQTGGGIWSLPLPLTPTRFAPAGGFVAASPDFGAPLPGTDVFLVDATGTLQLFTQAAPATSWRRRALSAQSQFVAGSQTFAVLPGTLSKTSIVNELNVLIVDRLGNLNQFRRDASQNWSLDTSVSLGATAANANIAGLVRYSNSQIAQELNFFYVDSAGALNRWTNVGDAGWSQTVIPLGGVQLNPGSHLATSVRFGTGGFMDDANVFVVDSTGNLICFSLGSGGTWAMTPITSVRPIGRRRVTFAPPGAPIVAGRHYLNHGGHPYQTDVFVVGSDGTLNLFTSQDGKPWSSTTPVLQNMAATGSILTMSAQAGNAPPSDPIQTNLYLCDINSKLNVFFAVDTAAYKRIVFLDAFDPNVSMLQGRDQVVLSTGNAILEDLLVTVTVTEDIVPELQIDALGNPVGGLSLQLNCNGAASAKSPWEQFIIDLNPLSFFGSPGAPTLGADVQAWTTDTNGKVYEADHGLGSLPTMATPCIPAGCVLNIELKASGQVITEGAFSVSDAKGKKIGHWTVKLTDQKSFSSGKKVAKKDLSEIVFFQLNIVGGGGGQFTQLVSGAGTIEYQSKAIMVPALKAPSSTGEDSTCIYSTVEPLGGTVLLQKFQVLP
jgi:hypothetical protein